MCEGEGVDFLQLAESAADDGVGLEKVDEGEHVLEVVEAVFDFGAGQGEAAFVANFFPAGQVVAIGGGFEEVEVEGSKSLGKLDGAGTSSDQRTSTMKRAAGPIAARRAWARATSSSREAPPALILTAAVALVEGGGHVVGEFVGGVAFAVHAGGGVNRNRSLVSPPTEELIDGDILGFGEGVVEGDVDGAGGGVEEAAFVGHGVGLEEFGGEGFDVGEVVEGLVEDQRGKVFFDEKGEGEGGGVFGPGFADADDSRGRLSHIIRKGDEDEECVLFFPGMAGVAEVAFIAAGGERGW